MRVRTRSPGRASGLSVGETALTRAPIRGASSAPHSGRACSGRWICARGAGARAAPHRRDRIAESSTPTAGASARQLVRPRAWCRPARRDPSAQRSRRSLGRRSPSCLSSCATSSGLLCPSAANPTTSRTRGPSGDSARARLNPRPAGGLARQPGLSAPFMAFSGPLMFGCCSRWPPRTRSQTTLGTPRLQG